MSLTDDELIGDLTLTWMSNDILWDAWLEALRSGKYAQGHTALLRHGRYCPLGVLCSVADLRAEYPYGPEGAAYFLDVSSSLPAPLARFMDITFFGHFRNAVPAMRMRRVPREEYPAGSIVSLNDTAEWSFPAMAEYLAEHRDNMAPFGA